MELELTVEREEEQAQSSSLDTAWCVHTCVRCGRSHITGDRASGDESRDLDQGSVVGELDPTCPVAKKPKHKTEAIS